MKSKILFLDCAALGANMLQDGRIPGVDLVFNELDPVFPAVTCTAQATLRTGTPPSSHGMVSNGQYHRGLQKPLFWEQSASLVSGKRIWENYRKQGKRVGLMFWQQSLGERADLILSPKPVHKHHGGMIQDCYDQPAGLYAHLVQQIGQPFNLMHYWGPLASAKSSEWIVSSICEVMNHPEYAPDLLLAYLPHLDYDLQRHGPEHPKSKKALQQLGLYLKRIKDAAEQCGYELIITGDYAISATKGPAVYPNRMLHEHGLMGTHAVGHRLYPDLYAGKAFAMVDHEVAHVYIKEGYLDETRALLETLEGVDSILEKDSLAEAALNHPGAGDLVLVAQPGRWFAYPWWSDSRQAPDFATHVDIHNKPGFDPCELFFGWPPMSVSQDTQKVKGTHGRNGQGRRVAWTSTIPLTLNEATHAGLATALQDLLAGTI